MLDYPKLSNWDTVNIQNGRVIEIDEVMNFIYQKGGQD